MLHLKFALNLNNIVDEIIHTIEKAWKDPLESPVVIFPDPKLEQWFKLRWIQRKGVLANLNKKTIDQFLFEILVGDDKSKKKLNAEMVRNVIIAHLSKKAENGEYNYANLDPSVKEYLETPNENGDSVLDEARLFDFANTLSGLFLEYETSRPENFLEDSQNGKMAKGILDCWKQDKLSDFFIQKDGSTADKEIWQRNLYSTLFHNTSGDSLLTTVFKHVANQKNDKVDYLTLPFLYKACRDEKTGKMNFKYNSKLPVFIIGLGGMGQFYRVILQEFAKPDNVNVFAYIQNPCMEFWEDCDGKPYSAEQLKMKVPSLQTNADDESEELDENENNLLRYWGKAGRDNIKLWSKASDYNFDFNQCYNRDEKNGIQPDTLLHNVQWAIANRKNKFIEDSLLKSENNFINDLSLRVTSAPNKIREVEVLHTHICKLLNGSATPDNKPAKVSDILVVSPSIDEYRTAIHQVFDQTSEDFHIPFSIVDSAAKDSLVAKALTTLFAIRDSGVLSRPDFFSLVKNPVVQNARNISPEEVSNWESWVVNTNTYRDRYISEGDSVSRKGAWILAAKRLLLSKLSYETYVQENDESISPYNDISSSDNNSLCRFVDCIESLEKWIDKDSWKAEHNATGVTAEGISSIYDFLDSWLSMSNPPKGLGGEAIIYQEVVKAKDNLDYQFAIGDQIPWKIFAQTLLFAAKGSEYSCGNLFINGITFMKFAPNRTIPIKYLFFIGADAKSFPGTNSTSTLDLRKSVRPWPGDDSIVAKNRYAFLCQFMSTQEGFFISYVNKNLQKDEDIYPSSVVNDIRSFIRDAASGTSENIWPDSSISLDEKRPQEDLFTKREQRNKKALQIFGQNPEVKEFKIEGKSSAEEKSVRLTSYQMKSFLSDPFIYHVEKITYVEENEEDPAKTEFEPTSSTLLQTSILRNKITALNIGIKEDKLISSIEELKQYAKDCGMIPPGAFGDLAWENTENDSRGFTQSMKTLYEEKGFSIAPMQFEALIDQWSLSCSVRFTAKKEDEIHFIQLSSSQNKGKALGIYVSALAYLCLLQDQSESIPRIILDIVGKTNRNGVKISSFAMTTTPDEARIRLTSIYERMQTFNHVVPFELMDQEIPSFRDYINKFYDPNNSPWKNFTGAKLFDIEKVCGYTNETFNTIWSKDVKEQKELTPELWAEKPADENTESNEEEV